MPMHTLRVTTWNVLHRIHALNWQEAAIVAFPDERPRCRAIAAKVCAWLASGVDVVCLQEVSGDQLAALREAGAEQNRLFAHPYPRIPSLRDGAPPPLDDEREFLVVLAAPHIEARLVEAHTFSSDGGKGFLAVDAGTAVVINTHVSFGGRGRRQIAGLTDVARTATDGAIVTGDFNLEADPLRALLGPDFTVSDPPGPRRSRVATSTSAAHTIDHVAVRGGVLASTEILDGEGLSDHQPVTALIEIH